MSFLKKTFGLFMIFAVIPAAYSATARPSVGGAGAATARPSVVAATASRRLPTMTSYLNSAISGSTGGVNINSSTIYFDDVECVENYTECITDADVCGEDFEECTTNVLFHAQMPKCLNVLMQCSSSGINALFGAGNVGVLSNVAEYEKDAKGNVIEVKRYTYPTDGSVMGQRIIGGMHANQYPDAATCSKRYLSCLNRDTVCGADFELCTSTTEFKKQSLQCESTLARCTADGVELLFGVRQWNEKGTIKDDSVIGEAITAGADLAAQNAVNTCYRVADQCLAAACANNPLRCVAGKNASVIETADKVLGDQKVAGYEYKKDDKGEYIKDADGNREIDYVVWTATDVSKFLKSACMDTIGSNKYCQMTANGKTPSKKELQDSDVQAEVFDEILGLRKERFESKVAGLLQDFDTDAKNKCSETIKTCAMRTCGGGIGSLCWAQVYGENAQCNGTSGFGASGNECSIAKNDSPSLKEIKLGCSAIVNADPYCIYAKQSLNTTEGSSFGYDYYNKDVFTSLFAESDPLGVVASLNASLQSSYDASSIANMKKQCEGVAISCVKSMCGDKYENCYRNRSDVVLDRSYVKTNSEVFDKSMNKVGGVLDTVVVLGLCLNTVKNSPVCEEHLLITSQKYTADNYEQLWGQSGETRDAWLGAGQNENKFANPEVQETNDDGKKLCYDPDNNRGPCGEMNSETKQVYDTSRPVMTTVQEYAINKSANGIFQNLLADMELEAQAIYNSELVAEQNACYAANGGGVNNSSTATYMWAKLKSSADMANYALGGFTAADFDPSNDLYGSYCRVRVNLTSNDTKINDILLDKSSEWNARYFVVGDAFTCGSWIPTDTLRDEILNQVKDANKKKDARTRALAYVLGPMASIAGGAVLGTGIEKGNILGGLTGKKTTKQIDAIDEKIEAAESCSKAADDAATETTLNKARAQLAIAVQHAGDAGLKTSAYEYEKDDDVASIQSKAASLKAKCDSKKGSLEKEKENDGDNVKGAAWGVGAATTVAGIGVTAMATETALSAQKDEEVQAIMDELNGKIRCTIGGKDVGGYGDIVPVVFE